MLIVSMYFLFYIFYYRTILTNLLIVHREATLVPIHALTLVLALVPAPAPVLEAYHTIDIVPEVILVVVPFLALALALVVYSVMITEDVMEIVPIPIIALIPALILAIVVVIVGIISAIVMIVAIVIIVAIREMVVGKIEM